MPSRIALPLAAIVCVQTFAVCQSTDLEEAEIQRLVASSVRQWLDAYESGQLGPRGGLRDEARLQPKYLRDATRAGFVGRADRGRLTHLDVLQKMLFYGEKHPNAEIADVVLGLAATGIEGSFLDRLSFELREIGHWTLMRMEDQGVWFQILRAAAGERVPVLDEVRQDARRRRNIQNKVRADEAVSVGPARRVAALRLLGQRGLPVFRSTLEASLVDPDPRVRLAAAESIRPPWKTKTIRRVATALRDERHPVVSQALVRLLFTMVKRPPSDMSREARDEIVAGAFTLFGKAGWRTDMDLVDMVEAYPSKAAIPYLIEALDLERQPDQLVAAVNKRASPLLRQRAGGLLRAMTGALVPIEDAQAWREFWAREQDHIRVPDQLPIADPDGTRVAFFGVPVTGTSIAFLIDTSGSMDDPPGNHGPVTGPRRLRRARTRLEAAKEQLTLATQAMDESSQFFLMTFSDKARTWTRRPLRPGKKVTRGLTGLLSRLNARGGTNLYDGLITALEIEGRKFGDAELPKIDELFVLSDGQPTTGEARDADTICEMVREANKYAKVRINTVFTGAGSGSALLERLAQENGGVFVQR
ncbi:MAG: VWA domain-containing protein [Planctomycetota bacterium]